MDELKLLHTCDHLITTSSLQFQELHMLKSGANIDMIYTTSPGTGEVTYIQNVKKIINIYSVRDSVFISPEIYNLSSNAIVWSGASLLIVNTSGPYRVPGVGEELIIQIQYTLTTAVSYIGEPVNCPRCYGNNWYIAAFPDGGSPSAVSGSLKVAQEFLKQLLTVPNTDKIDSGFGEGLMVETGVLYIDSALEEHISSSVTNAGIKCKEKQLLDSNRSTNELLDSVSVTDIQVDDVNSGVYVFITLITVEGKQVALNFKL